MSCNCADHDQSCNPCGICNPTDPLPESLPSALDNFTYHFFGSVEKVLVDGQVEWILPCNLNTGFENNPRLEGEGLACYFMRLFDEGITGYTGPQGPRGYNGNDGLTAFTATTQPFTVASNVQVLVQSAIVVPVGSYVFIDGAGWFLVNAKSGNQLFLTLIEQRAGVSNPVPLGSLVLVSGPRGPTGPVGARGPKGDKGDVGPQGATGLTGAAGASNVTTVAIDYVQPAVGSTETITVVSGVSFSGGQQIFVVGAGYYEVVSVSTNNVVVRNLGLAANAAPTTNITAGRQVYIVGVAPVGLTASVVASGTAYSLTGSQAEVTFGDGPIRLSLPMPGSYLLNFAVQVTRGGASTFSTFRMWNNTDSAVVPGTLCIVPHYGASETASGTLSAIFSTSNAATVIHLQGLTDTAGGAEVTAAGSSGYWVRLGGV